MDENYVYLVLITGNTLDEGAIGRVQKLLYDERACGNSGDATHFHKYVEYGIPYTFFTNKELTTEQVEKVAKTFMFNPVPVSSLNSPYSISILYGAGESLNIKLIGSIPGMEYNAFYVHRDK